MTNTNKFRYEFGIEDIPFCCGVREVGGFTLEEVDEDEVKYYPEDYPAKDGWRSTPTLAAQSCIAQMIKDSEGRPIQFWFKRSKIYNGELNDHFDADALRQVVMKKRGVVKLGTFINPGTKNHVDGYLLTAHATKGK